MTIFDEYKTYTGDSSISPSLLWEYDLSHFDWWNPGRLWYSVSLKEDG